VRIAFASPLIDLNLEVCRIEPRFVRRTCWFSLVSYIFLGVIE
jgi:hypothetical protein